MDISDAKSLSLLLYKPHYLKIFILNLPSGRKRKKPLLDRQFFTPK